MVLTHEPYKQILIRDHQHRVDGQSTPLIEEVQEPLVEMDPWKPDGKVAKEAIPLGAGAGPLRCPQVDPRIQIRKERRLDRIE